MAGRHVLDEHFDPELVVFEGCLLIGMRMDVNRVPAELRQAYRAMAFAAGGKRPDVAEEVDSRCREELAAGRHRRSRLIPVLWDVPKRLVLAPAFTDIARQALQDLFAASVDGQLEPLPAGAIAARIGQGGRRDFEDLVPSAWTPAPGGAETGGNVPSVPWSPAGAQDFLGNEFVTWLWSMVEEGTGMIETNAGEVAIAFERVLDMQCAWDVTGLQSLRAVGPCRLPEAGAALALGKWPRKVGLIVAARGEEWSLTLQADRFLVTGAKLAPSESTPPTERERLAARVDSVLALDAALIALYHRFVDERMSDRWRGERERIKAWVGRRRAGRRELVEA